MIIRASFSQEGMQYLEKEGACRLYIQGPKDKQSFPRAGMNNRHALAQPHILLTYQDWVNILPA